ncbi:MAG: cofactor-independent phosphoglycerate mutase [Clostridia bacterium]|nr:cofactor-independent phosphoglycerate mutase [Clostridia bacterium]
MKYLVLLGDGMADLPIDELGGKTPMECAKKPLIDFMAQKGEVGMCRITPEGCKGGSDVGNLSVMGYDPRRYLTGRAPLEAAAMGIKMADDDIALRCNLACVSDEDEYENKTMIDYSSDEITTAEASELIDALNEELSDGIIEFHAGISYRHILIIHGGNSDVTLTPPHDITGKPVRDYLPKGSGASVLFDIMKKSEEILKNHPVNLKRKALGLRMANTCWFWGVGSKPGLSPFKEKYGLSGSAVTAVDLVRGIAKLADMTTYDVDGATGTLETNFMGKAKATLTAFDEGYDFCYLHFEAPDECGHRHEINRKVKAIEMLDTVLTFIVNGLRARGEEYGVLIMPDHPTPISTGTHSSAPVPYAIYYSNNERNSGVQNFCEKTAEATGVVQEIGYDLLGRFFKE